MFSKAFSFRSSLGYRGNGLILYHKSRPLTTQAKKPFENIVRKGENAGNQHFLLFPQCFQPIPKRIPVFKLRLICTSARTINLDQSKVFAFGIELIPVD